MNYINNFNEGLEMKHERCDVKKKWWKLDFITFIKNIYFIEFSSETCQHSAVLVGKPFKYEKHFKSLFSKRYFMIIHRLVDVHSLFYFLPCLILPEYSMFWKVGFKKKT